MGSIILNIVVKYVSQHPDQIVELLQEAMQAGITALKAHNSTPSK